MNILIIEDEQPAAERIAAMVREFDSTAHIVGTLRGVKESIAWFTAHSAPDLILADIQLNDGVSFDIFKKVSTPIPVIFTTAYDEYLVAAFACNGIDYLLKPIHKEKMFQALNKYLNLKHHFTGNIAALLEELQGAAPKRLLRIVVKKGSDFLALKTEDIAFFYTEHKIVFGVDREGKRYIVDKPLAMLETELDSENFFRLNRKYIANIAAIARFRSHDRGKILITLTPPTAEEVIVSQENSSVFRTWIGK